MNKYIKLCLHSLLVIIILCILNSCDDERYDVEGSPENLIFFRTDNSPATLPRNSCLFNIVRTPVGSFGDEILVKMPVRVTRPFDFDVTVSISVVNSLVDDYNIANGVEYNTFPEGSFNLVKSSMKLQAGAYESADSLLVSVSKDQYEKFTAANYLLPIRLSEVSSGKPSIKEGIIWTFVNSEYKLIKDNSSVSDIQGSLVTDYSEWTISSTDEPTLNYATCLDGRDNTGVRFTNSVNPTIIVDMKKVRKLSGIRLMPYPSSRGTTYNLSTVIVELSSDNSSWTSVGTATVMTKDNYYQLIGFYEGIDARYIRLNLTWLNGSNSFYRNLRELGVYTIE